MPEAEKKDKTVEIPAGSVQIAQERVDKLNRRAKRLKVAPIALIVSEPFMKKILVKLSCDQPDDSIARKTIEVPYVKVTIEGEAPKLTGWTLQAQLERIEDAGMVLNVLPGQTVDEKWRTAESFCDHCKSKRKRLATYLFRDEAGKVIQIGSDCLKDFQGHDLSKVLDFMFESFSCIDDLEDGGDGSSFRKTLWVEEYLSWVAKAIREGGWVSRKMAAEFEKSSTADDAYSLHCDFIFARPKDKPEAPTADDVAKAKTCIKWVRESVAPKIQKSDYEHNLTLVLSRDVVNLKHLGIAASAVSAWEREMGRQIEREKKFQDEKKSIFQGEVGKRQVFEGLTLVFDRVLESDFGPRTLLKFKDLAGNIFVWFASGEKVGFEDEKGKAHGGEFVLGEAYDLLATVKRHEEFRGIKQTTINRASIDGEWGCICGCGRMTKLDTHCARGHEKGSWRCMACGVICGPAEKTCQGPYVENGVDRKDCGHSKQSWYCCKCHSYNLKKAKTCEAKSQDVVCGTPKKAWICRDWQCGKWNDPKVEVCTCGRSTSGIMLSQKEEVQNG